MSIIAASTHLGILRVKFSKIEGLIISQQWMRATDMRGLIISRPPEQSANSGQNIYSRSVPACQSVSDETDMEAIPWPGYFAGWAIPLKESTGVSERFLARRSSRIDEISKNNSGASADILLRYRTSSTPPFLTYYRSKLADCYQLSDSQDLAFHQTNILPTRTEHLNRDNEITCNMPQKSLT